MSIDSDRRCSKCGNFTHGRNDHVCSPLDSDGKRLPSREAVDDALKSMTPLRQQVEDKSRDICNYLVEFLGLPAYRQIKAQEYISKELESYAKRCEDAEKQLKESEAIWIPQVQEAIRQVEASDSLYRKQCQEISSLTRRLEVAEKETKPTIDGIPWYDFLSRVQKKLDSAEARVKELEAKNKRLRYALGVADKLLSCQDKDGIPIPGIATDSKAHIDKHKESYEIIKKALEGQCE